jgi:hypothetical protein
MGTAIVLHRSNVVESWQVIIENANGQATQLLRNTAAAILDMNLPDIYLQRAIVKPTVWSHEERTHLLVTNERFTEYPIHIGAHDYGNNLAISWYLVVKPPDLFTGWSAGDRNLFQQQELHEYVTVIHRCLQKAITELLLSFGRDPSQLAPTAAGFLGIT